MPGLKLDGVLEGDLDSSKHYLRTFCRLEVFIQSVMNAPVYSISFLTLGYRLRPQKQFKRRQFGEVLWISRRRLKAVESWEQLLSFGGDVSRRDFTRHMGILLCGVEESFEITILSLCGRGRLAIACSRGCRLRPS
jgi:hypothetical protein